MTPLESKAKKSSEGRDVGWEEPGGSQGVLSAAFTILMGTPQDLY